MSINVYPQIVRVRDLYSLRWTKLESVYDYLVARNYIKTQLTTTTTTMTPLPVVQSATSTATWSASRLFGKKPNQAMVEKRRIIFNEAHRYVERDHIKEFRNIQLGAESIAVLHDHSKSQYVNDIGLRQYVGRFELNQFDRIHIFGDETLASPIITKRPSTSSFSALEITPVSSFFNENVVETLVDRRSPKQHKLLCLEWIKCSLPGMEINDDFPLLLDFQARQIRIEASKTCLLFGLGRQHYALRTHVTDLRHKRQLREFDYVPTSSMLLQLSSSLSATSAISESYAINQDSVFIDEYAIWELSQRTNTRNLIRFWSCVCKSMSIRHFVVFNDINLYHEGVFYNDANTTTNPPIAMPRKRTLPPPPPPVRNNVEKKESSIMGTQTLTKNKEIVVAGTSTTSTQTDEKRDGNNENANTLKQIIESLQNELNAAKCRERENDKYQKMKYAKLKRHYRLQREHVDKFSVLLLLEIAAKSVLIDEIRDLKIALQRQRDSYEKYINTQKATFSPLLLSSTSSSSSSSLPSFLPTDEPTVTASTIIRGETIAPTKAIYEYDLADMENLLTRSRQDVVAKTDAKTNHCDDVKICCIAMIDQIDRRNMKMLKRVDKLITRRTFFENTLNLQIPATESHDRFEEMLAINEKHTRLTSLLIDELYENKTMPTITHDLFTLDDAKHYDDDSYIVEDPMSAIIPKNYTLDTFFSQLHNMKDTVEWMKKINEEKKRQHVTAKVAATATKTECNDGEFIV
ncbi:hypothetical protein HT594_00120 [Phenacoccus solenopsis nudivirus]|nr:hypothetical protein HT594_00120 [Phenacoccus solenopsis nudivirus]